MARETLHPRISAAAPGEMFALEARDHGISGVGIDMGASYSAEQSHLRAGELGVTEHVRFIHADATGYIAEEKFDIAACIGLLDCRRRCRNSPNSWNKVSNQADPAHRRTVLAPDTRNGGDR